MKGSLIIIGDVIFLGVCPPAIAFAKGKDGTGKLAVDRLRLQGERYDTAAFGFAIIRFAS